jgi:hypothetical protein
VEINKNGNGKEFVQISEVRFIVQIESGQQQVRDIHDRRLEQERDLEKFGNEQDRRL